VVWRCPLVAKDGAGEGHGLHQRHCKQLTFKVQEYIKKVLRRAWEGGEAGRRAEWQLGMQTTPERLGLKGAHAAQSLTGRQVNSMQQRRACLA
jgi:hypothetical protein